MGDDQTTPGERLRARYQAARAEGGLHPDPAQLDVVERLAVLADALLDYLPPAPRPGWLDRLRARRRPQPEPPRGRYIHGPVGRGKSMLMDLFFAIAPVAAKRRVHFHAFMLEVHARLDEERRRAGPGRTRWRGSPMPWSSRPGCSASTSSTSRTSPTR